MGTPAAEIELDEAGLRNLLAAQHPDLADTELTLLGNGWDNRLFRVGDALLARLPRRASAVPLLRNEQRWLTPLAKRLPFQVSC